MAAEKRPKRRSFPQKWRVYTDGEADEVRAKLGKMPQYERLHKDLESALRFLESQGPGYPSLETKDFPTLSKSLGKTVYQSYVQAKTSAAWRMYWFHDGAEEDPASPGSDFTVLKVFLIRPHTNKGRIEDLPADLRKPIKDAKSSDEGRKQ